MVKTGTLALAICTLISATAGAQRPAGGRDAARRAFDRAMHHYNLGEFELALERFKEAYDASPHADLLFDIGQCHRNLGHYDRAIFFFERYVEQLPQGSDAEEVQALLAELRTREGVVYDPPPLTATASSNSYDLSLPLPKLELQPAPPLVERWWFWAAILGAAAFAAGSVVLIASLTDPAEYGSPAPAIRFEEIP